MNKIHIIAVLTILTIALAGAFALEDDAGAKPAIIQELEDGAYDWDPQVLIMSDTSEKEALALADALGASAEILIDGSVAVITLPDGMDVEDALASGACAKLLGKLSLSHEIAYSEYDYDTDEDPWNQSYALQFVNLGDTWDTTRGEGITVAVVDSGLDSTLSGFDNISDLSYNVLTGDTYGKYGRAAIEDVFGHGTKVTSILCRNTGDASSSGVAPGVTLLMVKTSDLVNTEANMLKGIDYAIECGADVISMSFGLANDSFSAVMEYAESQGIVCVASAGNDGDDKPYYPASCPTVIGAGSINCATSEISKFSSYGTNVDVLAPGEFHEDETFDSLLIGTSFSAPITAGACALYLSVNDGSSPSDVRNAVYASAKPIGFGHDYYGGYGTVDINTLVCGETRTVTYDLMTPGMDDITQKAYRDHTLGNWYVPEKDGAYFAYWCEDKECTKPLFFDGYILDEDITVYAKWTEEKEPFEFIKTVTDYIVITGGTIDEGSLFIPDDEFGHMVIAIDDRAFINNKELLYLIPNEDMMYIGHEAFAGCDNLELIYIPSWCRLYDDSFGDLKFYDMDGIEKSIVNVPGFLYYIDDDGKMAEIASSEVITITISGDKKVQIGNAGHMNATIGVLTPISALYVYVSSDHPGNLEGTCTIDGKAYEFDSTNGNLELDVDFGKMVEIENIVIEISCTNKTVGTENLLLVACVNGNESAEIPKNYSMEFILNGDLNKDGKVNNIDFLYLSGHLLMPKLYQIDGSWDFNGDGKQNFFDVTYFGKYLKNPVKYKLKNM